MGWKDRYRFWKITTGRHNTGKGTTKKLLLLQSKVFLIFMLFFTFILMGTLAGVFFGIVDTTTELTDEELTLRYLTTIFKDKDGKDIGQIFGEQNRTVVSLNDMSEYLPKAFIAIEDERFREHMGIDLKRIIGAAINYIIPGGKTYGASTITQQLVKNLTGEKEVKLKRKIQEQWRALMLETKLSKDQILELYLNTIYLGDGAYGVQTAAKNYFDKDAKDLTLAESALIAGITQYPSKYDPTRNFEASKERQETVLWKMKDIGFITPEQYDQALNEKIKLKKGTVKKVLRQSYFIDAVCEDVLNDLQERNNISKAMAQKMLFNDGLRIYTTMDSNVQAVLEETYEDDSRVFSAFATSSVKPQSAMVIIDYRTGQVRGIVGGRGEKKGVLTFNRAIHARRQPGSSIKPIAVYAPALDGGLVTPATIIDDVPITIRLASGAWSPRNWYKDGFWGLSTIRRGIENSMNVVAVKVWMRVGADRSYDFMTNLGVTTLTEADKNSPAALALGGLTKGISPMEMTAAYGAVANGGYYVKPFTYTRVEDRNGRVLLENRPEARKVMDERAAYLLTDMLKDVVSTGTGKSARLSNMPAAGKTGTTSNNYDRWFAGYTPYYVGATWFGYDTNRKIPGDTNYSARLWQIVMEKIHKGLQTKDFVQPEGIVKRVVCIDSGKLPGELCRYDPRGSRTREEIFIRGTEPTQTCTTHVKVKTCKSSGLLATDSCPSWLVQSKVMIVRPEPYAPADYDAPMPKDRKYEAPFGEYCNRH